MANTNESAPSTTSGLPKALADFLFDIYDSVTLSQVPEEQDRLYRMDFQSLDAKYHPWPSPRSVASVCNGSPLFLSLYREMTHRSSNKHSQRPPTLDQRLEAWQVYQTCLDEILEAPENGLYLLPLWVFDMLQEFVYLFQGFCQLRSAVYSSARKQGLLVDDEIQTNAATTPPLQNLLETLHTLEANQQAWNAESVYDYLHRLIGAGKKHGASPTSQYFTVFGSIVLSRLDCLLGDFQGCLDGLIVIDAMGAKIIEPANSSTDTKKETYESIVQACWGARISKVYHAGISHLMLKQYGPATQMLSEICSDLLRQFKTGQLNRHDYSKQYDRMLSILGILRYLAPQHSMDESLNRVVTKISSAESLPDYFSCPQFVSTDSAASAYRQQMQAFGQLIGSAASHEQLRSLLMLYSQVDLEQLEQLMSGKQQSDADILPLLLSYQLRQGLPLCVEGSIVQTANTSRRGVTKDQSHWEEHFVAQMIQADQVRAMVSAIDTNV